MATVLDVSAFEGTELSTEQHNPPAEMGYMGLSVAQVDDEDYDEEVVDGAGRPAWVLPAAIGGGVLVVAGAYLVLRKKKGGKK